MSYIAYLNYEPLELISAKDIALNKQVNDIARLDTRQSNFTPKFIVPPTANNIRVLQRAYVIGNQSNVPYQKNRFDLIDAESGKHLIYDGWATVSLTTDKGYEINTYDGIVSFYKIIELLTLSDCQITGLDHVKDLPTIMASWDNTQPYKYILADYNGKKYTASSYLNADYLVPCAKISYLWDRVHAFAGMSYSGSIFATERFVNLFMTFPKPVPTDAPIMTLITSQNNFFGVTTTPYGTFFYPIFLNTNFDTADANNNIDRNVIEIETAGAFRLTANYTGSFTMTNLPVNYVQYSSTGSVVSSGAINAKIGQNVVLTCSVGDRIFLSGSGYPWGLLAEELLLTTFELITGYSVNFSQTLVDFMAKDFVNDIMQHLGLTAFKDPYSNNIEYLTTEEVLQNNVFVDWSSKYVSRINEAYILPNYAQRNNFAYRYNGENLKHNDGYITINNENLKDETTVVASHFYSPEQLQTTLLTKDCNVYKLWDKEVKDDGTVTYKDLSGRYYLLRSADVTWPAGNFIGSEALGTSDTFTVAPFESYYRLKMQQVIYDNYNALGAILDKSKMVLANFWLTPSDYEAFDFKKLLFVRQLGSYFLVNKIVNFVKGQPTRVELIEVDYMTQLTGLPPTDYVIQFNNDVPIDYVGCEATFTIFTDAPIPSNVQIVPYALTPDGIGGFYYAEYALSAPIVATIAGSGSLVYTFTELPAQPIGGYIFKLRYYLDAFNYVESGFSNQLNVDGACYVPVAPPTPDLSYLKITSIEVLSIVGGNRNLRINYISDLSLTDMPITANWWMFLGATFNQLFILQPQNGYVDITVANLGLGGTPVFWQIQLSALGVNSNIATS